MRLTILTLTACSFLGLTPVFAGDPPAAGTSTQEQPGAEHRSLAHAAHEIKAVIESLEKAKHDFGGHREAAIKDCKAAEKQLREGHEFDLKHDQEGKEKSSVKAEKAEKTEKSVTKSDPETKDGKHHEMSEHARIEHAITVLENAIDHLQKAPHDFGGHRVDAVKDCQAAMKQLREALAFAEKNETK